ncbi:MAG: flagellar assembly peptidoglycan hydrolase FlgJ [Gammaproteobacteria bacterium]|nr:flagellar assembly peptidoglycan hydrolase FlgJ [Gammaproteobacteria bacterium]
MSAPTATAVATDFSRFTGMKAGARRNDAAATRQMAREFEALFVQLMLKEARATLPAEGAFGGGEMGMYYDLFDQQAALLVAEQGRLGLAQTMLAQLGGDDASATPAASLGTLRRYVPVPEIAPARTAVAATAAPSPAEFLDRLLPHAQRAAAVLGTRPETLLAQAALETGWGQHQMHLADGRNSNNIFSIKATADWQGATVRVPTMEVRGGQWVREYAEFRAYPDLGAAFADYLALIQTEPRYRAALHTEASGGDYAAALQRAGYATDPEYADKIDAIAARVRLHLAAATTGSKRG